VLYNNADDGKEYILNLIDTPGHVDFSYEVSRSLAACEGAILVVDATQGIQAQTLANVYLALEGNLEIIPILNKIDLKSARTEEVSMELGKILGVSEDEITKVSAKTGEGIEAVLGRIVKDVPAPAGDKDAPLQALIFDSQYNSYRGVVALVRVINGYIEKGMKIKFMRENAVSNVEEVGIFGPEMIKKDNLSAGEVGYMITGIKEVGSIVVGDTVTNASEPARTSLPGYKKPKPMVYSGLFPIDGGDYENLRDALGKLSLNDASLDFIPEVSNALGYGYRCGFLGLLHMEIIKERLEREYGLKLITTAPNVAYRITLSNEEILEVKRPSDFPDLEKIMSIEEPYTEVTIITPKEYIGKIMKLAESKRGDFVDMIYISIERVEIKYIIPLSEIIVDFFDQLKSISSGYGSLDYEVMGFEQSDLVKLDILVAGDRVDELSVIVHQDNAYHIGRELALRLRKIVPRQNFEVPIQATIGKRIIAKERVAPYRKDVTAKLYGGDITRKRKLLEKQKKGKKRMKKIGRVDIPDEAFMSFYEIGKSEK
jgi:GTP-binding protein LepA